MKNHGTASMGQNQAWEFASVVVRQLPPLDAKVAQGWIENQGALQRQLAEALSAGPSCFAQACTVTVDYSRPFAEMVQAGRYSWVSADITEKHFPLEGKGKNKLLLFLLHFKRQMTFDGAIAVMEAQGYRPAAIGALLAFGEYHHGLQREFSAVALGSVWRSRDVKRRVPAIWATSFGARYLGRSGFDPHYPVEQRFLAFRE